MYSGVADPFDALHSPRLKTGGLNKDNYLARLLSSPPFAESFAAIFALRALCFHAFLLLVFACLLDLAGCALARSVRAVPRRRRRARSAVDDNGDLRPWRKVQTGALRSGSEAASYSGMRARARALPAGTGGGVKAWAQAVDHDDGHQLRNFAPLLPAMETPQIVRAHDPDESDSGAAGQQPRYRIVGVSRLNDSFETGDIDARMMVSARAAAIRSASGARPLVFLSGLPGVTSHQTRSSLRRLSASRAAARCA